MNTYYQSIAPEYVRLRRVHAEVLRSLMSIGALSQASSVLDVGCGTGNYLLALNRIVDCDCWGVDPSDAMLAEAQSRLTKARLICASAEQMELPADQFDLVFAVDVAHHLTNRLSVFHQCLRVLRPGGKLCLVTESTEMLRQREPHATYFPDAIEVELARYPSIAVLKSELMAAGFVDFQELQVELQAELTDIEAYRAKAHSSLQMISQDAFDVGIKRLAEDLHSGPIPYTWRYILLHGTKSGL